MKICLIGNNITNYVLANVLTKKNFKIDIIGKSLPKKNDSIRTLAISNSNLQFIRKIVPKINIWPSKKIKIFVENSYSKELFEFNNKKKNVFNLIKYKEFYNSLYQNLKSDKLVKFIKIKNLDSNLFKEKKYNFIINSSYDNFITKKFFFNSIKKNYSSTAFTCVLNHSKLANNIALQIFTKYGPLAFLPLSNRRTSVVFSYNGKGDLSEKDFKKYVKEYNNLYKRIAFSRVEKSKLYFQILRKYFFKNILAFGDLLHKIHPLAGQGFNMTIKDIKILSNLIDERVNLGLEMNSELFDEFEKKTKSHNYIYANSVDFIYEFFKFDSKIKNLISDPIFKLFKKNNMLNSLATRLSN